VVKFRPRQCAGDQPLPWCRSWSRCRSTALGLRRRRLQGDRHQVARSISAAVFDDSGFAKTILLVEPVEPFLRYGAARRAAVPECRPEEVLSLRRARLSLVLLPDPRGLQARLMAGRRATPVAPIGLRDRQKTRNWELRRLPAKTKMRTWRSAVRQESLKSLSASAPRRCPGCRSWAAVSSNRARSRPAPSAVRKSGLPSRRQYSSKLMAHALVDVGLDVGRRDVDHPHPLHADRLAQRFAGGADAVLGGGVAHRHRAGLAIADRADVDDSCPTWRPACRRSRPWWRSKYPSG